MPAADEALTAHLRQLEGGALSNAPGSIAMTRTPPLRASLLASCLLTTGFQATTASPYFGQPVPGLTPALFVSGAVSTDANELSGVFAPDLKEFFFTRVIDGTPTMVRRLERAASADAVSGPGAGAGVGHGGLAGWQ